jgi:signal transduction histidine kinase
MLRQMAREQSDSATSALRLAARIHDASAGLAIGIGLLKGWTNTGSGAEMDRLAEVLDQVQAQMRQLSRSVTEGTDPEVRPATVRSSLERAAKTAGVRLELKIIGREDWLTGDLVELLDLAGREAIRNVKRHSGTGRCRITLDVSSCPFALIARDWGAGIQHGVSQDGGITLLEDLARGMGAVLTISSQPGLGTKLTVVGPSCVLTRRAQELIRDDGVRSVVADESASSRRRVASKRPAPAAEQQIT